MKKWLNSENLVTFAMTVAAVIVGIYLTPKVLALIPKKTATA